MTGTVILMKTVDGESAIEMQETIAIQETWTAAAKREEKGLRVSVSGNTRYLYLYGFNGQLEHPQQVTRKRERPRNTKIERKESLLFTLLVLST